jgi:hypothetical protein
VAFVLSDALSFFNLSACRLISHCDIWEKGFLEDFVQLFNSFITICITLFAF